MSYSVLGVDASMTSTGWMHYGQGDKTPTWGLKTLPSWGDNEGQYLWEWFEWLGHLCVEKKVTHLFIEDTRFSHKHEEKLTNMIASICLIGQASIVAYKLGQRGQQIEFQAVSPIDWRREFLGNMHKPSGIAGPQWRTMLKEAAIDQCLKRGWIVESDDIADAGGIMTFGICTIDDGFRVKQGPLFRRAEQTLSEKVREL